MERKKKTFPLWGILAIATTVFTFALLLYVCIFADSEDIAFEGEDATANIYDWTLNDVPVQFPESLNCVANDGIMLKGTLPDLIGYDDGVMIYTSYCSCYVYVENKMVASYGSRDPLPMGHMLGNIRLIAPLDSNMAGKEIKIVYYPKYNIHQDINEPIFSSVSGLKYRVLRENLFRIILCVFALSILFLSLALFIRRLAKGEFTDSSLIYLFGQFVFLVLMWIVCSSDIPQFFTNNSVAVCMTSFISLSAMCIPLMGFCEKLLPRGKRIFGIMYRYGWIIPLINVICFVFKIADPIVVLPLTHAYMIASVIFTFIFSFIQRKADDNSMIMFAGMVVIGLSALGGLICFVISPSTGYASNVFVVGFVLYFLMMLWVIVRREIALIEENKFITTYRTLAYTDVMTNMKNRTAFEDRFGRMKNEDFMLEKNVILYIFNLDKLRDVNAQEGHSVGDKVIIGLSECIMRVFERDGECYRIGGDEFAVIMINKQREAPDLEKQFEDIIIGYNKTHEYPIKVSYGKSIHEFEADDDFSKKMYLEADKAMFEMFNSKYKN